MRQCTFRKLHLLHIWLSGGSVSFQQPQQQHGLGRIATAAALAPALPGEISSIVGKYIVYAHDFVTIAQDTLEDPALADNVSATRGATALHQLKRSTWRSVPRPPPRAHGLCSSRPQRDPTRVRPPRCAIYTTTTIYQEEQGKHWIHA